MSCEKNELRTAASVVRYVLALGLAALFSSPAALAVDSGDILVISSKGDVTFTMNGAARTVRAGGALELPASIRTGRDGSVELKQGATTVSVGPETLLEFPALEKRGAPIDRIVQPRGNAFYNIGKREGRKLRVETPYLVGVIKGTQFNVAAVDGATTISLFEGLIEIRAADDSSVLDLKAGEIASLKRGDKVISVIPMNAGKLPPTAPRSPTGGDSTPRGGAPDSDDESLVNFNAGLHPVVPSIVDASIHFPANAPVDVGANVENNIVVGTDAAVSSGNGDVEAGASAVVNLETAVDLGASAGVDAGPVAVDAGAGAAIDLGSAAIEVAANTNVDAGPISVVVDTAASVAAGVGTVDVAAGGVVDAGPLTTDVGAGAAVDVGAGTVSTGVDVAGLDLDLGVDLGLDDDDGNNGHGNDDDGSDSSNPGHGSDNKGPGNTDLGELLDGLLRRPGRKK